MYCKNCGQQMTDDSMFCSHCGTNLTDATNKSNGLLNAAIGIATGSIIGDAIVKHNQERQEEGRRQAEILNEELQRKLKATYFNPN